MKFTKIIFAIFIYFFILNSYSFAEQNLKFVDIDLVVKNTDVGKKILKKLNELDQQNVKKLNDFENELKTIESEIKFKKNIISEDELKKEIDNLNLKLADYKKLKNEMVKKLSETKNNELKKLFKAINPIIQNYMDKNSIEILLNSKNVFIGNKNSDLTQILIEEINNKLSG
jgi:outer membrane protein